MKLYGVPGRGWARPPIAYRQGEWSWWQVLSFVARVGSVVVVVVACFFYLLTVLPK